MFRLSKFSIAAAISILYSIANSIRGGIAFLENRMPGKEPIDLFFILVSIAVVFYLMMLLKEYLNEHLAYHDANILIWLYISSVTLINCVVFIIDLPAPGSIKIGQINIMPVLFFLLIGVCLGVISILLGRSLLKRQEKLLRYYAYAKVATGTCMVSCFLSPGLIITELVACILLALIFLKVNAEQTAT